jgi:hypothetical protein
MRVKEVPWNFSLIYLQNSDKPISLQRSRIQHPTTYNLIIIPEMSIEIQRATGRHTADDGTLYIVTYSVKD